MRKKRDSRLRLNNDGQDEMPMDNTTRRSTLCLAGALICGGTLGALMPRGPFMKALIGSASAATIPPAARLPFTVSRGGSEIGRHVVSFVRDRSGDGERLTVDIEIDLSVSFAFITAYEYRHRNREIWVDGRLVSMETTTDDNGDSFFVTAQANGDSIRVESTSGSYEAPSTAIPSSYWNRAFLDRDRIINTQDGRFMPVSIEGRTDETIRAAGRDIAATRYDIGGLAPLSIWYSGAGQWVKLAFDAQGSEVSYLLNAGAGGASTLADG
ncbi:DUF6134 family protein [Fodinicurvata sp. EGI_FJ10296]|uniref:DUF6134 family protein n=1 Tax=Fodinicurvata sp. EGI_FJ10296 TaxID=3231908 RepID=UPI00345385B8